jgi:hypothetical protein
LLFGIKQAKSRVQVGPIWRKNISGFQLISPPNSLAWQTTLFYVIVKYFMLKVGVSLPLADYSKYDEHLGNKDDIVHLNLTVLHNFKH